MPTLLAGIAISPTELVVQRSRSRLRQLSFEQTSHVAAAPVWLSYTPPIGFGVAIGFLRIVGDLFGGASAPRARLVLTRGTEAETLNLGYVRAGLDWYLEWHTPLFLQADVVVGVQFTGLVDADRYSIWAEVFLMRHHAANTGLASTTGTPP